MIKTEKFRLEINKYSKFSHENLQKLKIFAWKLKNIQKFRMEIDKN